MTREPTDDRKKRGSTFAWSVVIATCLLTAYVAAYFNVSTKFFRPGVTFRVFNSELAAQMFVPAAFVEAKITRLQVEVHGKESDGGNLIHGGFHYYAKP